MIKTFGAENYGCLKKVEATLTPLHAFIGPNDSGKSTLLLGFRSLVQFAGHQFDLNQPGRGPLPFDPLPFHRDRSKLANQRPLPTLLCSTPAGSYSIVFTDEETHEAALKAGSTELKANTRAWNQKSKFWHSTEEHLILQQLQGVRLVRFDPDALRQPSALIPESGSVNFLDERGLGLPGIYFTLLSRGTDAFQQIAASVRQLFPVVKHLRLPAISENRLVIEVELRDGTKVRADRMSEGLLYYLAFAALRHLDPVSLLLIEEPENGLHPARIAEVVRMLRAIVNETGTQIVMATHSPLVINELEPDEVTVVTRPSLEEGTKLTPIKATHNFEKRSSVYALGELWLSYANGVDEQPLIQGSGE